MAKFGKEQASGSEVANVGSAQQDREEPRDPTGSKVHGKSKEVLSSHEARLTQVEEDMGSMEKYLDDISLKVEGLEAEIDNIQVGVRESLAIQRRAYEAEIQALKEKFMAELDKTLAQMEEARGDMLVCKRAMLSAPVAPVTEARHVDVPKPMPFVGVRNAREVDNFLWRMEQYLDALGIQDESSKIKNASLYLSDTAMLWWRRRQEDVKRGTCHLNTFEDFKRELKRQFYPENAEDEARGRLRRLKQEGSIQDYVKDFTGLVLDIPDMSDKDSLFYFMDGLQNWAKTELKRRGVQDLATAIATAESLVDYSIQKEPTRKRDQRKATSESEGEGSPRAREDNYRQNISRFKEKGKESSIKPVPRDGCFICGGPHWTRECPKKKVLSALAADLEESSEEGQVGTLQLLNALRSTPKVQSKGLMFVNVKINGKETKALVDTGASHNFISLEEAKRMGLKINKGRGMVKAVNSAAKPIHGVATKVKVTIGGWTGHLDMSVAPIDDFSMVLGMEFFDQVKAFSLPFANILCIMDGGKTCAIPATRATRVSMKTLSVLQLIEDPQRSEERHSASLCEANRVRDKLPKLASRKMTKNRENPKVGLPRELLKERERNNKEGNKQAQNVRVKERKSQGFWTNNNVLYKRWEDLKDKIMKHRDFLWARHCDIKHIYNKPKVSMTICKHEKMGEQRPSRLLRPSRGSFRNFEPWWKRHMTDRDIKRTPRNTNCARDIRPRGVLNFRTCWKKPPTTEPKWKPKEVAEQFREKFQKYQRDEDITKSSGGECHAVKLDPSKMAKSWRKSQA